MATIEMWPRSSVTDVVPILATTLMPAPSQVGLVVEAEIADPDDVALGRPGAGEHLEHAHPLELVVDVPERHGRRHVVERDDPLCLLYTSPSPRDGLLSRMPS